MTEIKTNRILVVRRAGFIVNCATGWFVGGDISDRDRQGKSPVDRAANPSAGLIAPIGTPISPQAAFP
jgi:hypothetical protein